MDADDLRLFLRTAASGNLSASGRALGLSPAVASKRMANLEKRLGVTLLHRTTRQVSLTPQGQIFEEHAKRVLAEIEGTLAALGQDKEEPAGVLRVTAPATLARRHVAPVIAEFLATYPKIELDVRLADSMLDLQSLGIDVAIRIGTLEDSQLIAKKIAPSPRVLCASPKYLAAHGHPKHPSELANHNCMWMTNSQTWTFDDGGQPMRIKVNGNLHTNSGDLLRQAALVGLGITIKSIWDVEDMLREGQLVQVLPDHPLLSDAAIWLVYQPHRFLPARIRTFVDFFADRFGSKINVLVGGTS